MKKKQEIDLLASEINPPKIALALFCYNQEKYIIDSLNSCLNQDYKELQIIISDDASTDKTLELIRKTLSEYNGQHKIKLNVNKENMGIGKHFAFVMDNLIDEDFVVMCAGDDISMPNRVSRVVEEWISNGKPSLVTHGLIEINESGEQFEGLRTLEQSLRPKDIFRNNTHALREYIMSHYPIPTLGAVNSYKMKTYKQFGTPATYSDYEDHLMLTRSLLDDGVHYFQEKLVYYRTHQESHTSQAIKPFYDNKSSLLSQFFNKKNLINEEFINCYQSHKVFVQLWIDYKNAIKNHCAQVDYHLVEYIWANLVIRHNYLMQNKSLKNKLISKTKRILHGKNTIKNTRHEFDYIKPLNTVIFGTGDGAKNLLSRLSLGFKCIAACNTVDSDLLGKKFQGLEIIDLAGLQRIESNLDCIIISSNKFYYQIKKLISEETKIPSNKILKVPQLKLVGQNILY